MSRNQEISTVQGPFLGIENAQLKSSHSIFYNWKVSDVLIKFAIKATIVDKNNETNDKFYRKVAFLMYTEIVNFRPQS